MSENCAVASHPHLLAVCAPSGGWRSVNGPSTPSRMYQIVQVQSQACGGLSASRHSQHMPSHITYHRAHIKHLPPS
eukprot:353404-Chlamydomonas_euryale.AAC.9